MYYFTWTMAHISILGQLISSLLSQIVWTVSLKKMELSLKWWTTVRNGLA